MVSVLDCSKNMEDITHIFVKFYKPSYNYETFLSPMSATGPRFLRPCAEVGLLAGVVCKIRKFYYYLLYFYTKQHLSDPYDRCNPY